MNINELRDTLFETLNGIKSGDIDLDKARAINEVSKTIIDTTNRYFDKNSGQMKDGDTLFMRCSAWNELAENITESLRKGMRVLATGNLRQRTYEDRNGIERTIIELRVEDIGPSLKWATTTTTRNERRTPTTTPPAASAGGSSWPDARPVPNVDSGPGVFSDQYTDAPF